MYICFKLMLMQRMDMNIDDTTKKGWCFESELKNSPISITFYGQPQLTRSTFFPAIPREVILPLPSPMNQLRRLKLWWKVSTALAIFYSPRPQFFLYIIGRRKRAVADNLWANKKKKTVWCEKWFNFAPTLSQHVFYIINCAVSGIVFNLGFTLRCHLM